MMKAYRNANLHTPRGVIPQGTLYVNAVGIVDRIAEASERLDPGYEAIDMGGLDLLPGLIDVHVHGGGGWNVMGATHAELDGLCRFHASQGTTALLATTVADRPEVLEQALRAIKSAVDRGVGGAELLGAHLEGPFLNVSRAGAQNKDAIYLPNDERIGRLLHAAEGSIRLVTLAPEIPGGLDCARRFVREGTTVSIGHSAASYAETLQAVELGASHTTHHFNGMSPLHHREPGVAGAGLMSDRLTIELIMDGLHVRPELIKWVYDVKGARGICAVTDAIHCAGMPDGDYGYVVKQGDRIVLQSDGVSLAGSSLTMIRALRNAVRFTGYAVERLLPSFTEVPARQAGVGHRKGSLEQGKDADFIVVDEDLQLYSVVVRGRQVHHIA